MVVGGSLTTLFFDKIVYFPVRLSSLVVVVMIVGGSLLTYRKVSLKGRGYDNVTFEKLEGKIFIFNLF